MSDGQVVEGSFFIYAPNKGAAVFFTAAFAVSTLLHFWQCQHYKSWKLTMLFGPCALLFTAGFAIRIYCAFNYKDIGTYIATNLLIYSSPPILELQNYHILGRILHFIPYCAPLHPGRVFTTFATLSFVVEILNGLGVAYSLAPTRQRVNIINLGHALMKASLLIQLIVAVLFVLLAAVFQARCRRQGIRSRKVSAPLATLYVSTALITIRTIYRTVEYFEIAGISSQDPGSISSILRYEWFFYVLEAVPMLLDCALFNVFHPRRYIPENSKTYLAQDGKTELEGPGWSDSRPFVATLVDPFDCVGALTPRKKNVGKFWESNGFAGMRGAETGSDAA